MNISLCCCLDGVFLFGDHFIGSSSVLILSIVVSTFAFFLGTQLYSTEGTVATLKSLGCL